MPSKSRREFLSASAAAAASAAATLLGAGPATPPRDLQAQLLELANQQMQQRMARFAAVATPGELESLQRELRRRFLALLDDWPERDGTPAVRTTGRLAGDGYTIEKLAFASMPGYWVTSLLYRPTETDSPHPAIVSPCGHSAIGKAAATYQTLHINLAKRGFIVLTYDPVGQAERSQFWDAEQAQSRYNLVCGEHSVLGNPLYLLGTSLAKYRIWDGIRAIDYVAALPDVDSARIGCIGSSGGGTLTAYLSALDDRIRVPVISCYVTSLPHRMGNRIEADPDSDPEQDIFGFVEQGIDHAGLLAMMAPRPTMICAAQQDFFPIEGTRQTFAEAEHLYRVAGATDRIRLVEANTRHGLSIGLREAAYGWFQHWLNGDPSTAPQQESSVAPLPADELQVCADGQVNSALRSRPLLPLALGNFRRHRQSQPQPRNTLQAILRLAAVEPIFRLHEVAPLRRPDQDLFLLINGFRTIDWRQQKLFLASLAARGAAAVIVDPRGIGQLRGSQVVAGHPHDDPLCGVEENLAYNALLVGRSLAGMRVADVHAALASATSQVQPKRVVACGCLDAGLLAALAAATEPRIDRTAIEGTWLSFLPWFAAGGVAINAAELVPGLLRDFGDIDEVLAQVAPRQVLAAACEGRLARPMPSVRAVREKFSDTPELLDGWLSQSPAGPLRP